MLQELTITIVVLTIIVTVIKKAPLSKEPEGEGVDDQFCVELAGRLHMLGRSGSNHSSYSSA